MAQKSAIKIREEEQKNQLFTYVKRNPNATALQIELEGFSTILGKCGGINKVKREAGVADKYIRHSYKRN